MSMCYVAIKECGCCVAACVDAPETKKSTAKTVADWVKRNYIVERWDTDKVRVTIKTCECNKSGKEPGEGE